MVMDSGPALRAPRNDEEELPNLPSMGMRRNSRNDENGYATMSLRKKDAFRSSWPIGTGRPNR